MNCGPLSEDMSRGTPNLATQWATNAWAQLAADVLPSEMASSHREERSITVRRWVYPFEGGRGLNVDVIESAQRDLELLQRGSDVRLNFGSLAGDTLFCPHSHLLLQTVPNELVGYQLPCGWVGQAVDKVKHLPLPSNLSLEACVCVYVFWYKP